MRKLTLFTAILALITATAAMAPAATHKGNLVLPSAAQINGTQLKAGNYNVRWEGEGPTAQVTILQGRKTVATANATVKDLGSKSSNNAVTLEGDANSVRTVKAIVFDGKTTALEFGGEAGDNSSGGGNMR